MENLAKAKSVSSIMSNNLITVDLLTTIEQVEKKMNKHNIHHMLVVSNGNKFEGIISVSDIQLMKHWGTKNNLRLAKKQNRAIFSSMLAEDLMKTQCRTISEHSSLAQCAEIFKENLFHALPVIRDEKLIGIITTYDLLTEAYK